LPIGWSVATGTISLDGLLRVKGGAAGGQLSPARLTALISTVVFAITYASTVLRHPQDLHVLDIPEGWLLAIGGTHLTYLGSKMLNLVGHWTGPRNT
jgi:hypothetical protein